MKEKLTDRKLGPRLEPGVSKFKPNGNHKRVFIYGSFSLNKSVEWVKKTNLY